MLATEIEGGAVMTRGAAGIGIPIGFSVPVPVGDETGTCAAYRYFYPGSSRPISTVLFELRPFHWCDVGALKVPWICGCTVHLGLNATVQERRACQPMGTSPLSVATQSSQLQQLLSQK